MKENPVAVIVVATGVMLSMNPVAQILFATHIRIEI